MRVPQYERRRFRIRGWMIAAVVIALVLLFSLRSLAGFYTDYLWFDSLGQGNTWGRLLSAKVVPALVFTVAFFLIMLVNLVIADRLAPAAADGPAHARGRDGGALPVGHRAVHGPDPGRRSRCSSP